MKSITLKSIRIFAVTFLVAGLLGCMDPETENLDLAIEEAQDAASSNYSLEATNGSTLFGVINSTFLDSLTVTLKKGSNTVSGESVRFEVEDGVGSTVGEDSVTTDSVGVADTTFISGSATGTYRVRAHHDKSGLSVLFILIANEPKDPILEIVSGNFQVGGLNSEFTNELGVRLIGNTGEPTLDAEIIFTIGSGAGQLSKNVAKTNEKGISAVNFTSDSSEGTVVVDVAHVETGLTLNFTLFVQSSVADKVVKIVEAGVGNQPEVTSRSIDVAAGSMTVKAALYNADTSKYIEDVSVVWTTAGGNYTSADFVGNTAGSTTITFNPTKTGSTVVQATYTGTDQSVIGPTDTTGSINVTTILVPAIVSVVSGDGQTGVVNNNLSLPLKVRVTTANGTPVPGEGVVFTSVQGSGSIITGQPVVTDDDGLTEALVQLSTLASTHVFRATLASNSSLTADFSATAIPGPATKLAVFVEPSDCFEGFQCLTQPQVVLRDQYNNNVTGTNANISVAVQTGTGNLSGDNFINGISTTNGVGALTDLTYDTEEAGVIFSFSATGLTSANTSAINVGPPLVSACSTQDIDWKTEGGGCKDQSTNLIWSSRSSGTMNWHAANWDAYAVGGGGAAEVEQSDNGKTNEYRSGYGVYGGLTFRDNSTTAYCHSLVEGGKSDWRMPLADEIQAAYSNGIHTHVSGLNNWLWTNTRYDSDEMYLAAAHSGSITRQPTNNAWYVICVRSDSNSSTLSKTEFKTMPGSATYNEVASSIVVKLTDSLGNSFHAENTSVTLSVVSGPGNISGTLTRMTDAAGEATFDDIVFDDFGLYTLTATSGSLTAPVSNNQIMVGEFPGSCINPDASFASSDGGCRQLGTDIVWSRPSENLMTWQAAIWDASVSGASQPDASDNGWTNEYHPSTSLNECYLGTSKCDSDPAAYCHDLVEGGYDDWIMPAHQYLTGAWAIGLASQVAYPTSDYHVLHRRTDYSTYNKVRFTDGVLTHGAQTQRTICIRNLAGKVSSNKLVPIRGNLIVTSGDSFEVSARVYGFGGEIIYQSGVEVTLSLTSGSGNLTGVMTQYTNRAGIVVFDNLTYDTDEYITLSFTNDAGLINESDFSVHQSPFPGACAQETAQWQTGQGGCQSQGSKLVYGSISASAGYSSASATTYCDQLIEGGFSDWRITTQGELSALIGLVPDVLPLNTTTGELKYSSPGIYNIFTGGSSHYDWGKAALCVRQGI